MLSSLRSLVEATVGDGSLGVFQYSDRSHCEQLWRQMDKESAPLPWSSVVIIYEGQSDRTDQAFRPEHWLTPWDWALAKSISLARDSSRIPPCGFRCLIVDMLPSHWGSGGRSRFKLMGALAPWVRWYRPLSGSRPLVNDFSALFKDLKDLALLPSHGFWFPA